MSAGLNVLNIQQYAKDKGKEFVTFSSYPTQYQKKVFYILSSHYSTATASAGAKAAGSQDLALSYPQLF